ncbi:MAG TPA: hypothetical protein VFS30_13335 [Dehalococcoidia bacterium]|nr:hypothetical protein [Dehalococcoidia bacterium]
MVTADRPSRLTSPLLDWDRAWAQSGTYRELDTARDKASRQWLDRPTLVAQLSRASKALDALDEFVELEPDWDSYGASPISEIAIEKARGILNWIAAYALLADGPEPVAVPLADGGVQLEWIGDAEVLEIEVSPEGNFRFFAPATPDDKGPYLARTSPSLIDVVETLGRSRR